MERCVDEKVAALLARRAAVAEKPESEQREMLLQALDEVILELETSRWPETGRSVD